MIDINSFELKDKYEMYNRIQNDKRKSLLVFIYESNKNYTQLMEFSKLKPGSLYHHLNVLMPLIEKKGHGLYTITDLGKEVVERLNLIQKDETRPKISDLNKNYEFEKSAEENIVETYPILITSDEVDIEKEQDEAQSERSSEINILVESKIEGMIKKSNIDWDDPLSALWLGKPSYIIIGIIAITTIILAIQGIALAGSAIYMVGDLAFAFDLFALFIGIGILYYIELGIYKNQVYNKFKYITIIRVLSMLPATVMGIGILLITYSGVALNDGVIPWIFSFSIFFGTIFAASGISYLRGTNKYRALVIASIPSFMDLFLGIIIILNT